MINTGANHKVPAFLREGNKLLFSQMLIPADGQIPVFLQVCPSSIGTIVRIY